MLKRVGCTRNSTYLSDGPASLWSSGHQRFLSCISEDEGICFFCKGCCASTRICPRPPCSCLTCDRGCMGSESRGDIWGPRSFSTWPGCRARQTVGCSSGSTVQLFLRLYSLPSFSLIQSDWVIQHCVFNKISMHVCVDDPLFINRIELKFIFLDYQGNLWYVECVKIDHWWYIFICCFRLPSREAEYLQR